MQKLEDQIQRLLVFIKNVVLRLFFYFMSEIGWNVPSREWRTAGEDKREVINMNEAINIIVCTTDGR